MYDLKAMRFEVDSDARYVTSINGVFFLWTNTPEGLIYWTNVHCASTLPQESAVKIQAMRDQYERENRPAVGVLHDWDGGGVPPVPVASVRTTWDKEGAYHGVQYPYGDWSNVTQYLVHSYPELKRISGTVAEYDIEPDFTTWVADDAV